jgi:hypothetical protein
LSEHSHDAPPAAATSHILNSAASQIAFILRQGEEGTAVGEICRKAREATYYNWRKKHGGLMIAHSSLAG